MAMIAHAFVLDELESVSPLTKPMFGSHAVYVDGKICFILRSRTSAPEDNGVWVVSPEEHVEQLARDFPSLRRIQHLKRHSSKGIPTWRVMPEDADDFEESVLKMCAMVRAGDPRIGKIPSRIKRKAQSRARMPSRK